MMGWRLATRLSGMVSTLILARLLAPSDFGLLAMATAFSSSVDALSQIGTDNALVRHDGPTDDLQNTAFTMQMLRGMFTAAMIAAIAPFAATWFAEPRLAAVLYVLALVTALAGLDNVGAVAFRREMEYRKQFWLLAVPRVIQIALTVPAAFLLHSYWALLIGILTNRLCRLTMTYALHPYRPRLSLHAWRELTGFSVWSWGASLARIVWERTDSFFLASRLGPSMLGFYTVGQELALLPMTEIIDPVVGVLIASLSELRRQGENIASRVPVLAAAMLIGVLPIALTISAAALDVSTVLLGPRWDQSAPIIAIMALCTAPVAVDFVIYATLIVTGHMREDFEVMAAAAVVKVIALLIAVPTGDIRIIAFSILGSSCLATVLFILQLHRVGRPSFAVHGWAYLRTLLSAAAAATAAWCSGLAWQSAPLPLPGALLRGTIVGTLIVGTYAALQFTLWRLSGGRQGPESMIIGAVGQIIRRRIGLK